MREEKEKEQASRKARSDEKEGGTSKPDFNGFVTGLYSQTLLTMGVVESPDGGEKKTDLNEAQFLIDTLGMLERKTSGNLTEEEENYLRHVLNDLRMRYVEAARKEKDEQS